MSDILQYRGTVSGSNATGITEVSSTNPLPVTVTSGTTDQEVVGNVASGATNSGNPVLTGMEVNTTNPTFTAGQRANMQGDTAGNLKVTLNTLLSGEDLTNGVFAGVEKLLATNTYNASIFLDAGTAATLNIKASAGNLLAFICTNGNAAVRYLQIHNTATTPGGGATALWYVPIPAGGSVIIDRSQLPGSGLYGSSGLAWAVSTTAATYTAATAADHVKVGFFK